MIQSEQKSALKSIINIFLDVAEMKSSQKELNIDSSQSKENNSVCLNKTYIKKQLDSQDSCSSYSHNDGASSKLQDFYDQTEETEDLKKKYNQQQNIIKNILKSFLSYLTKLQDSNMKLKYQQMYSKQSRTPFSEIKKAVSKKVNIKANRWNFQLNSILNSQSLRPIFYDYLNNISKQWLQKSKVSNLVEHQNLIDLLLNCIENNKELKLRIYKKKK